MRISQWWHFLLSLSFSPQPQFQIRLILTCWAYIFFFSLWVCLMARCRLLSGWCEASSYMPMAPASSCCGKGEVLLLSPAFDQACARAFAKEFSGHPAGPCHVLWQLRILVGRLQGFIPAFISAQNWSEFWHQPPPLLSSLYPVGGPGLSWYFLLHHDWFQSEPPWTHLSVVTEQRCYQR